MSTWMVGKSLMKHQYLKKIFYSNLNIEHITDADYIHAKAVCKDFEIKKLDEYDDLMFLKISEKRV